VIDVFLARPVLMSVMGVRLSTKRTSSLIGSLCPIIWNGRQHGGRLGLAKPATMLAGHRG